MKMRKSLLCLLLALCLCLCLVFVSCDEDPEPEPDPETIDETAGHVHTTVDTSAGVGINEPNEDVEGYTPRQ